MKTWFGGAFPGASGKACILLPQLNRTDRSDPMQRSIINSLVRHCHLTLLALLFFGFALELSAGNSSVLILSNSTNPVIAQLSEANQPPNSQSHCVELTLDKNGTLTTASIPQFDGSKGKLSKVQISTDCVFAGAVKYQKMSGDRINVMLNGRLSMIFPNQLVKEYKAKSEFSKDLMPNEDPSVAGTFSKEWSKQDQIEEMLQENLAVFLGTGNFNLGLIAQDLASYKDADSEVSSKFVLKVCVTYHFE
jgi:hypothetical protein